MEVATNSRMQVQEIEESIDNTTGTESLFNQFDSVVDFSDHHYAKLNQSGKDGGESSGGSKVAKRIMQEWKILQKDLPESIYVRVYEGRIDLLRAVIIGAAGTPYHDGLFFFDLHFPSDYPAHPPEVFYHSYGLRINPNLYNTGKVCLSLLNTWGGRMDEKWNAKESTILQVLVSIQALVLNARPYYNEPINSIKFGRKYWDKKALSYNEEIFILNCKTMLYVLSRPPLYFKNFVSEHFRNRAHLIILACKAYMDGTAKVGGPIDYDSSSSSTNVVSKKFKPLMEAMYPKLLTMFTNNGSALENFIEEFNQVERKKVLAQSQEVVKTGLTKKVFNKVKKMLGFKNAKKTTT